MLVNRLSRRPPAALADPGGGRAAMLATTISNEYSWYSRTDRGPARGPDRGPNRREPPRLSALDLHGALCRPLRCARRGLAANAILPCPTSASPISTSSAAGRRSRRCRCSSIAPGTARPALMDGVEFDPDGQRQRCRLDPGRQRTIRSHRRLRGVVMLTKLSLRLRIFLFFCLLGLGGVAVDQRGALDRLSPSGLARDAERLRVQRAPLRLRAAGLVAGIWLLFDENVAKPIERLAARCAPAPMPASTAPMDLAAARYLGDLAPAAQAVAGQLAETSSATAQARRQRDRPAGRRTQTPDRPADRHSAGHRAGQPVAPDRAL